MLSVSARWSLPLVFLCLVYIVLISLYSPPSPTIRNNIVFYPPKNAHILEGSEDIFETLYKIGYYTRQPPEPEPKTWVSMGLCYNKNAQFNGKARYPYKDVTPLALLLWKYYLPGVHTIIR